MALTVVSDCTISFNVSDVDPTNTIAANGDAMQIQETQKLNYGAVPLPTIGFQWSLETTLVSTSTTLDLTALPGPRGSVVSFASIRQIYIFNEATTTLFTLAAGGAANPWTPSGFTGTWTIQMQSRFYAETGDIAWVVDGTHKTLKIDSGAHTIKFKIILVGS